MQIECQTRKKHGDHYLRELFGEIRQGERIQNVHLALFLLFLVTTS